MSDQRRSPAPPVAVVTDSTAYLPAGLVAEHHLGVVPLSVVVGGVAGREGEDVTPADVARTLAARRPVSTSRPSPDRFAALYADRLAAGAPAVVSIHLSARLSGTYRSAVAAAADFDGRVTVIDSGSTGMGLGFPVLAAARAAAAGADPTTVHDTAVAAATRTSTLFCVDSLEHLRRGGRIGAAAALVGNALAVKPILWVSAGRLTVRDKVRTTTRAQARLVELAAEDTRGAQADLAVHHLAQPERAAALAARLHEALPATPPPLVVEVGAVVGAHAGPGLLGVVVSARP